MNKRKRLLITASTFPRWDGDTEPRFILDYAKAMSGYYDVTVLVPAAVGAKDREVLEGVKVIRYHYFPIHKWETLCYPGAIVPRIKEKKIRVLLVPFLFLALYIRLFRILSEFDIIHAHWLIPQGIVQSFFRKPYIVTGHGSDVTSLNMGIVRKLKMQCLRKAKSVIVVSEYLKDLIMRLVPEIEPSVISMGVDASKFGIQYRVPNYFEQGDKKVILFVGRLVKIKGVIYLINAMKSIDAMLVIVGDGPLREELELQSKPLKGKVIFLGAKTHEELKEIYASADIFTAPSVSTQEGGKEGLGIVMLEAMASGLPVVATRTGGIPDLITDGKNGLLFEQKNITQMTECINKILNDEELRISLISEGIKTVEDYDYKNIAKKYKEVLDDI